MRIKICEIRAIRGSDETVYLAMVFLPLLMTMPL